MSQEGHDKMIKAFWEELKGMVRSLPERRIQEERATPTKANGYSTRDLLTVAGPLPRVRVRFLPYRRRTSPELSDTPPGWVRGPSPAFWRATPPRAFPASFRSRPRR